MADTQDLKSCDRIDRERSTRSRGTKSRLSSAVEQLFCKQQVVGSNPTVGSCMSESIKIMGLTIPGEEAAKMEQVQTAALREAKSICAGHPLRPIAQQYVGDNSIAQDTCARANQFTILALANRDPLAATQIFQAHAMSFACRDLTQHTGMVVGLAKGALEKGGF